MNCPRCAANNPNNAKFCISCGWDLTTAPATGPATGPAMAAAPQANKLPWILGGVGLLIVLILGGVGLLMARGSGPGETLKATGKTGPAVTQRTETPAPAVLPQGQEVKQMPPDVLAWLEHLERIERLQRQLVAQQTSKMSSLSTVMGATGGLTGVEDVIKLTDPNSEVESPAAGKVQNLAAEIQQQWMALSQDFNSLPPPPECAPLRTSYDAALQETANQSYMVAQILEMVATNPQQSLDMIHQMQASPEGAATIANGRTQTDQGVGAICDKYGVRKWFEIPADIKVGGGLLGR